MHEEPACLIQGARHVWRPYCQMKTAPAPLAAVSTHGSRLVLADGRELVDGIANWWIACHGHNHPHICAAVEDQVAWAPHVMFGDMAHEPAWRRGWPPCCRATSIMCSSRNPDRSRWRSR